MLIDKRLKAWIFDINHNPSFNILSQKEFMGKKNEPIPVSQVDFYVKKMVYQDALKVAFKSRSSDALHQLGNRFQSLTRLYNFNEFAQPLEDENFNEVHEDLKALRLFFYTLTGRKDPSIITS